VSAAVPLTILVARIHLEERFLATRAPSYVDYAIRVPYRLVPGIW
jgi:protein-S-isoprenylcysteine O-methyltransferase Ste14